MKCIVKNVISYQCKKCKTYYPNKKDALKCEAMPVEKKLFLVGDKVAAHEKRECTAHQLQYRVQRATVLVVRGPKPFDYEYEVKWLGGRGVDTHVYEYEVEFIRPCCHDKRTHRYYAPEIKKA